MVRCQSHHGRQKLIWDRTIETNINTHGSTIKSKNNKYSKWTLGLGLLDWEAHTAAIRIMWLLNYCYASDPPWKEERDQWFSRSYLGRGAILSSLRSGDLTAHIRDAYGINDLKATPPPFWAQALFELRKHKLTPINTTREGARGQPLWSNPRFKPLSSTFYYQPAWEHLSGKILDNMVHDSKPYNNEELEAHLTPNNRVMWHRDQVTLTIEFANKSKEKYDTRKLYKSWRHITSTISKPLKKLLAKPEEITQNTIDATREGTPLVLITRSTKEWSIILNHQCLPATRNHKGVVFISPDASPIAPPLDLALPARWGKGYTGKAKSDTYPIPQEFTFDKELTIHDNFPIKALTRLVYKKTKENLPTQLTMRRPLPTHPQWIGLE
jgi:hypothetical protein